jgi:hypothetical protein
MQTSLIFRLILSTSLAFQLQLSFAGPGYTITIKNNSDYLFAATGIGGGGNSCWYSYDLDYWNLISPHSQQTFYTEASNRYIRCSDSSIGYQRFLLINNSSITQFSLVFVRAKKKDGEFDISTYLKNEETQQQTPSLFYNGEYGTYCGTIYIDAQGNIDDNYMNLYDC